MTFAVVNSRGEVVTTLRNAVGIAHAAMAIWMAVERRGFKASVDWLNKRPVVKVAKGGKKDVLTIEEVK